VGKKGILKTKVVRQKRQNPKISSHFGRIWHKTVRSPNSEKRYVMAFFEGIEKKYKKVPKRYKKGLTTDNSWFTIAA
jgi:hypothetical protein